MNWTQLWREPRAPAISRWRRFGALACAVIALALAQRARAQTEDFGIWTGVTITSKLPPSLNDRHGSWRLWLDVQLRFGDDASRLSQALLRPGVGYALSRAWTVWAGYAWVQSDPPYAASTITEQRIWEQASWSGAIGSTRLSSRTRLEERFVSTGSETGWRARELAKITVPLGSRSIWTAVASDEYFYNLNSTNYGATAGPDRNRLFIGPGLTLSKAVYAEIGYLHQHTYGSNGPDKRDNILALNLFWTL